MKLLYNNTAMPAYNSLIRINLFQCKPIYNSLIRINVLLLMRIIRLLCITVLYALIYFNVGLLLSYTH